MTADSVLRNQLSGLLERSQAHIGFDEVVSGIAADERGKRVHGCAHSAWELVEHIRLAQRDILDFCREAPYVEMEWPADYWPATPEPPSPDAWDRSVEAVHADRAELQRLVLDPDIDLVAVVPNGTDQTYLREVLLVADHNSYHVGQLSVLRRSL